MQKGQTLIEVLVAFAIALLVVSAVAGAILSSLSGAESTKTQNLGTQFSQQGIDFIRSLRDSQYSVFKGFGNSAGITYCFAQNCFTSPNTGFLATPLGTCGTNTNPAINRCPPNVPSLNPLYAREVTIQQSSSSCISGTPGPGGTIPTKVSVAVYWSDSKCPSGNAYCHKVIENTCLSDLNVIPTP